MNAATNGQPSPFDFAALAASAQADNPDALLLELMEQHRELRRRLDKLWRGGSAQKRALVVGCQEYTALEDRIAELAPTTAAGLVAKCRFALSFGYDAPIFRVQRAALKEALAWLDPPKPRRGRPTKARSGRDG